MSQSAVTSTTQDFLDIHDITNDLVFMKDGSAAAILAVNAMNFSLLAEEEQDAVIYAYASLLNSLNFQIQINIQSRTKDATVYLDLLKKQEDTITSVDKRKRIARYREFVGQLIQERNVLDKKFYVIIPAGALEMGLIPPQSVLPGSKAFDINSIEKSVLLEKALGLLDPRVDHLVGQFGRIGLYARRIATQEIIQNFYTNYNPEAVEGQQITDSEDYTTPLVQASLFSATLQNRNQTIKQFSQNPEASLAETASAEVKTNVEVAPMPEIEETAAIAVIEPIEAINADPIIAPITEEISEAPTQSDFATTILPLEQIEPAQVEPAFTEPLAQNSLPPLLEQSALSEPESLTPPILEPVALPQSASEPEVSSQPPVASIFQTAFAPPQPTQPTQTAQSAYSLPPLPEIT